jgi:hypothetical protein
MRQPFAAVALTAFLLNPAFSPSSLLDPLWAFFSSLWSVPAQSDEGCGMDPDGGCSPASRVQSDEGCGMDPPSRPGGLTAPQPL